MPPAVSGVPGQRRPFTLVAALAALVFSCLVHWPVFLGRVPFPSDIVLQFPPWEGTYPSSLLRVRHADLGDLVTQRYPWFRFAGDAAAHGALPLWNPRILLGTPNLANMQSAVFYPFNIPYFVLPTALVWAASFIVHSALAFFFTAVFARRIGASRYGALTAGAVFAAGGFMVAWQGWALADSAVWLPAVLLAVDRLCERATARRIAIAGVAFAMPVLAGHPEIALYVVASGGAFWLHRTLWPWGRQDRRSLLRAALAFQAAGACALGLAAVHLLPGLEWLGSLSRGFHDAFPPLSPRGLLGFISRDARATPNAFGVVTPEGTSYMGVLTLALAPLALFRRASRRDAAYFGVFAACALQVVYGWGPAFALSRVLPVISALLNTRMLLLVGFGLAVLSALGMTHIEESRPAGSNAGLTLSARLGLFTALLVPLGAALAMLLVTRISPAPYPPLLFGVRSSVALAVLAAALIAGCGVTPRRSSAFAVAALVIVAVDLGTFASGHVPYFAPSTVFPEPPVYRWIKQHEDGPYRVVTLDLAAPASGETVYGVSSPTGNDFVDQARWSVMADFASPANPFVGAAFKARQLVNLRDRRLDLFNVRYLLTTTYNESTALLKAQPGRFKLVFDQGHTQLFENLTALPRAFLLPASSSRVVDREAARRLLADPSFDPSVEVLLERPQVQPAQLTPRAPAAVTRPEILTARFGINRHEFRVRTAEPAILVLSEGYYPGWRARIDDRPGEVLRVDAILKGCVVPPGTHKVVFRFLPASFAVGAAVSSTSALLIVFLVARRRRSLRSRSDSTPI